MSSPFHWYGTRQLRAPLNVVLRLYSPGDLICRVLAILSGILGSRRGLHSVELKGQPCIITVMWAHSPTAPVWSPAFRLNSPLSSSYPWASSPFGLLFLAAVCGCEARLRVFYMFLKTHHCQWRRVARRKTYVIDIFQ